MTSSSTDGRPRSAFGRRADGPAEAHGHDQHDAPPPDETAPEPADVARPDAAGAVRDRPGAGRPADEVTGTLRRTRPPRRAGTALASSDSAETGAVRPDVTGSVPVVPSNGSAPAPQGPTNGSAPVPPEPVRRPGPTFPSPGQPPPAVGRRDGRHARAEHRDVSAHTPPSGYRPRHAAPDAETEQFLSPTAGATASVPTPVTGTPLAAVPDLAPDPSALRSSGTPAPALVGPVSGPIPAIPGAGGAKKPLYGWSDEVDPDAPPSERVRIVLAERRAPTRAVRTVAEIEQQTETGEFLLGNLLRAQMTLGIRLALVMVLVLGALPVLFLIAPTVSDVSVLGVRVPWLMLGFLPYPFLLVLAWIYTRTAERNELDFADNVED